MPFIGRGEVLDALLAAYRQVSQGQRPGLVLVAGEAGMGKTALLAEVATRVDRHLWGTCWDGDAPALWPWTQVLRGLDGTDVEKIVDETGDRLVLFDAIAQVLRAGGPLLVVLDDLQWSDPSTVELIRFLLGTNGSYLIVGAYRPEEWTPSLGAAGRTFELAGLSEAEVAELVGAPRAGEIHRRSGGNPFFARELALVAHIPVAVREVIGHRISRLSPQCGEVLRAAAVAGNQVLPDVLSEVTGSDAAAILPEAHGLIGEHGFAHDLYRETIYSGLAQPTRIDLHHRVAQALVARMSRGGIVYAAELARHFAYAAALSGPAPVLHWAREAASADRARYAYVEAAAHLARARESIASAGHHIPLLELASLLSSEAEDRFRAGDHTTAQQLLDAAWQRVADAGDPRLPAMVALGIERLGARFAMPRGNLIAILRQAARLLDGSGTAAEAQITAALARQLAHSVPAERLLAGPPAQRAVAVARSVGDPAILAECLLAEHDSLWSPGNAQARADLAREITALAGDTEMRVQGLLLNANALLELGSPQFRVALAQYEHAAAQLRQPRHDYLLRVRQAALALLDGDTERGERFSSEAAVLGETVGDPDTGNVAMSQRLELVRIRHEATELRQTAQEAIDWWIGVPTHAHAVAAGFYARAGDLDAARRELDLVLSLDQWRADRSYLWSVYIGEMAVAAIATGDRPLCTELLEQLLPVSQTCAVNGAVVCFMGAHAHRIGLLHQELGDIDAARAWLSEAVQVHRRLGAAHWVAESESALANLEEALPRMTHRGGLWLVDFRGRTAHLRHGKGLQDLAILLARPGVDVAAIDLAGSLVTDSGTADPVTDRAALIRYRQRLSELDETDPEREQLLSEIRRAFRPGGGARSIAVTVAEKARKAVTARIRETINRIAEVHPELGTHLDRSIRTGLACRYEPSLRLNTPQSGAPSSTTTSSPRRGQNAAPSL